MDLRGADVRELADRAYSCLPGCGFCCTFPPAVARGEEQALRGRFPALRVVGPKADRRLALQGGCGACVLLSRRACTAYDLRPRHCRHFPFHVHFGPEPEVHLNATCRGVVAAPGGDLRAEFQAAVLDAVDAATWQRHAAQARSTYAEFERRARAADAWSGDGPPWTGAPPSAWEAGEVEVLLAAAGDATPDAPATAHEAWRAALEPFGARDVVARPFHLAADLRWWTFAPAPGGLRLLEMQEDGTLREDRLLAMPDGWTAPPLAVRAGLDAYVARLARRGAFRGSVLHRVDAADYQISTDAAWRLRLAEVLADLAVRVAVLRAMGVEEAALAAEAERCYDSAFLDAPTVGGWL